MKSRTTTGCVLGLAAAITMLAGCAGTGTSGSDSTAAPTLTQEFPSAPAATPEGSPTVTGTASSEAAAAPDGADGAVILIKGFAYEDPDPVTPGAEITVTNEDVEAHSVTADTEKAFDVIAQVGTTTFTAPTEPGSYPYHCIFHANMKGTLIVE